MFSKRFIAATKEYCTHEKMIPAPLMRKAFEVEKLPRKAELIFCGLGFYRLFLNGEEITKGQLAPYQSNPDDLVYYERYDLSKKLLVGKNVLGIILGNGFLNSIGGQVWDFDKGEFRSAPKTAFALETEDGVLFEADTTVKTCFSPIIFDDLREGEHYDAREEILGWANVEFDDSAWDNAIPAICPKGEPTVSIAPTLEIMECISPKSVKKHADGYMYDFGLNTVGYCNLFLKNAEEGQKIRFTYFERLDEHGNAYLKNLGFFDGRTREGFCQQDEYICRAGEQSYKPSFTWHGYRYVFVEGLTDEQAKTAKFLSYEIRSDVRRRGSFSCSDETAVRICELVLRSDVTNLFFYPLDCPHREKNGWTADAALSCEQMLLQLNVEKVFAEWLKNIRKAQRGGALPGIIPTAGWGFHWGNGPAWDCILIWAPYEVYRYRGDVQILQDNASAILEYLRYMRSRRNEDGLLAFGLGDWCQSTIYKSWAFETPLEITDSMVGYDLCKKAAKIFDVLKMTEAKAEVELLGNELMEAFRKKWVIEDGCSIKSHTQTAQSMAIRNGVFAPEQQGAAVAELVARIHRDNDHFNVGVVGGYGLFETLAENGCVELAYRLITQKTPPSYGYIVERGETSLWESMYDFGDSKSPIALKNGEPIVSMNHHFWGFVYTFFVKYIAGLRMNPNCDDVNYAEIKPNCICGLSHAEAEYETSNGRLSVKWQRSGDDLCVCIVVPEGMQVKLSVQGKEEYLSAGDYKKVYKDL